jgi:hypothetical protein
MIEITLYIMITAILAPFMVAILWGSKDEDWSDDSWYN